MKIRDGQDFWAGLMFVVIGLLVVYGSRHYDYGSAAKMGPGFFPMWLGSILAALGAIVSVRGLMFDGDPVGKFNWKPLVLVLVSIALFGVALQGLGFVIAIFAMVFVSCLGGHEFNFKEVLLLAVGLTIGSVAIFNYGLQLQFPIWPW